MYIFDNWKLELLQSNCSEDFRFVVTAVMGIGLPVLSLTKILKNAEWSDI